jgi:hypothetical protein
MVVIVPPLCSLFEIKNRIVARRDIRNHKNPGIRRATVYGPKNKVSTRRRVKAALYSFSV